MFGFPKTPRASKITPFLKSSRADVPSFGFSVEPPVLDAGSNTKSFEAQISSKAATNGSPTWKSHLRNFPGADVLTCHRPQEGEMTADDAKLSGFAFQLGVV